MSGLWVNSVVCAVPTQACARTTCENKQIGLFPCPRCSTKKSRGYEGSFGGCGVRLFLFLFLSKEDELPLQEQYLEKGVGSFLAGGTALLTQPWQDGSSLFQGYLGSACPGCEFPRCCVARPARGWAGERACAGGSFLPLLLLPDQYLSVFPLLLRYHQPVGTRNVFIYMVWPGEHSQFPILKKKKRSLRFKVIFESVWIFLSDGKRRMTESWGHLAPECFLSGPRAKFWAPLGGFFVGFFSSFCFLKRSWMSKWYYFRANYLDCFLLLAHSPGE